MTSMEMVRSALRMMMWGKVVLTATTTPSGLISTLEVRHLEAAPLEHEVGEVLLDVVEVLLSIEKTRNDQGNPWNVRDHEQH